MSTKHLFSNPMGKIVIGAISLIGSALAHAEYQCENDVFCGHNFAIQSAIATGGNFGIGIVDYTQNTEIGFTISGSTNNAPFETKRVTPVLFGGLRYSLCESTYFAWGLNLAKTFGTVNGNHINSDIAAGLYISLEQMLTSRFMLAGWIDPYQYEYRKAGGVGVTTNQFFSTGGIGINFLF